MYDCTVYVTLNFIICSLFLTEHMLVKAEILSAWFTVVLSPPKEDYNTFGLINICILQTTDPFACAQNENHNSFVLVCAHLELFGDSPTMTASA